LVAAFRATLEEIQDADLLVHVLDLTHPNAEEQSATVDSVLQELGVGDKPRIVALNKIDRLFPIRNAESGIRNESNGSGDSAFRIPQSELQQMIADLGLGPGYIPISADLGWGLDSLLEAIQGALRSGFVAMRVLIPYQRSELVSIFHEKGIIESEEHGEQGTLITGRMPRRYAEALTDFAVR
jgi:GTP-binding protein HflX